MSKKQISLILQIGSVKWGHERPLFPRKVLSPILSLIKEQKEAILSGQATLAEQCGHGKMRQMRHYKKGCLIINKYLIYIIAYKHKFYLK